MHGECLWPGSLFGRKKDGKETDVDCGGPVCVKCADGKMCGNGVDCLGAVCMNNLCKGWGNCMDMIKNGLETDVDCGGMMCPRVRVWENLRAGERLSDWKVHGWEMRGSELCPGRQLSSGNATRVRGNWRPHGDGKADLAVADSSGSRTVCVLLNTGNGAFAAAVNYAAGGLPQSAAIGDLNGDGKPDLAVASSGGSVDVLLNSGNGTFAAPVNYSTGNASISVSIGDLNGDGEPDLAVANSGNGNVSGSSTAVMAASPIQSITPWE